MKTVGELNLKPGDVVRFRGANYLVSRIDASAVSMVDYAGSALRLLASDPIPKGFGKVQM
jgi:hypothetical protein